MLAFIIIIVQLVWYAVIAMHQLVWYVQVIICLHTRASVMNVMAKCHI